MIDASVEYYRVLVVALLGTGCGGSRTAFFLQWQETCTRLYMYKLVSRLSM